MSRVEHDTIRDAAHEALQVHVFAATDALSDARTVTRLLDAQSAFLGQHHRLPLFVSGPQPNRPPPRLKASLRDLEVQQVVAVVFNRMPSALREALADLEASGLGTPAAPDLMVLLCQRPSTISAPEELDARKEVMASLAALEQVGTVLRYADDAQLRTTLQSAARQMTARALAARRGRAWLQCPHGDHTRPAQGPNAFCPNHGDVLLLEPPSEGEGGDPAAGRRLLDGRYPLHGPLAPDESGRGRVHYAISQPRGLPVAVKLMPRAHPEPEEDGAPDESLDLARADLEEYRRFEREIEVLKRVRHPNVVEIIDSGCEEDGTRFMVMSFLEGEPLSARLGRLTVEEGLRLVDQGLQGLAALHAQGVVHRDFQPENLMVGDLLPGDEGPPKVTVMGLSLGRPVEGDAMSATQHFPRQGASGYVAPEQYLSPATVGPRADIYAAGVLLYRLVAGRLPFEPEGVSAVTLAERVSGGRPPPIPEGVVSPAIERLISQALEPDPMSRPPSAGALRRALRDALDDESPPREREAARPEATPAPAPEGAAPVEALDGLDVSFAAHGGPRALVLLALLALIGGVLWWALGSQAPSPESSQAPTPLERA